MRDDEAAQIDFRKYWGIIRKRRYIALAVGLVILSLFTLGSFIWPKTYVASTTVLIQRSSAMAPIIRSVSGQAVYDDMLRNIKDSITSRSVLDRVVKRLPLAQKADWDAAKSEGMIDELRRKIEISFRPPQGGDVPNYFSVAYKGSNPSDVLTVVNTVVEEFINENATLRRTDASSAYVFIEKQLAEHKEKMETIDSAIKAAGARAGRSGDPLRGQTLSEMQTRLSALNSQLSALTAKFTEEHPEVLRVRSEIGDLKRQMAASRQNTLSGVSVGQSAERTGASDATHSQAPVSKLQRDRLVNQRIYEDLQTKLENARVTRDIEMIDMKANLKVVEPAILPIYPAKPDRVLIILIGLFLSVAAGLGTPIAMEMVDRSFKTEDEIVIALGIPVLASIPQVVSAEEAALTSSRDRRILLATGAYLALIALILVREVFLKFLGIKLLSI